MGIGVIVNLFLLLIFNNIKCGLSEIGTASSYEPPYTRKFKYDSNYYVFDIVNK